MPTTIRQISAIAVALGLLAILGCNRDGKFPVSGVVTWNGQPIGEDHNGHIILTPEDPKIGPDASKILPGGTFRFRSSPGAKRVEIFVDRPVGEPDPVMKTQVHEQYIPTRYNEQTELTVTVKENGSNEFRFDLVSEEGDEFAGQ